MISHNLKNQKLFFLAKSSILLLFTSLLTLITSADPKCAKVIKCASSKYISADENICITYHSENSTLSNSTLLNFFEYDKSKCKAGFACKNPTENINYSCIQKPSLSDLMSGGACLRGTQCASYECNNGLCAGKPENGTCTGASGTANHNICNAGLFCTQVRNNTKFTCHPQKNEGDDCDSFFACKNNLVCNYFKCVKAFSLLVGAEADEELACATRYRFYSETQKKSFCADLKLDNKNATHCNLTIGFNNITVPMTLETQCTVTEDKDSYCPLPSDSAEWKGMISTLNTFVNSKEFAQAHVSYKKDFGNFDNSLNRKIEPVLQYPRFKGADECVIQLYLKAGFIRVGLFMVAFLLFGIFA